jgi:anti-sigma regulatory factor (Ser/Thr protein kinase)
VLVIRFDRSRAGFDVELPAAARELVGLRHRVERWLEGAGASPATKRDITLAVHEAAANVVRHAYRHRGTTAAEDAATLRVSARRENGALEVVVSDTGTWRERSSTNGGGRGIDLMQALMDDVAVESGERGTTVTLVHSI